MKLSISTLVFALWSLEVRGNLLGHFQSKPLKTPPTTKSHTIGVYGVLRDLFGVDVAAINEHASMACKETETVGCSVTSWHPEILMDSPETVRRALQGCSSCDDDAFVALTHEIQHMFDVNMELSGSPARARALQGCSSCDDDAFVEETDNKEDNQKKNAILTFLSSFCNSFKGDGVDCSFNVPETHHNNGFPMSELSLLSFDRPTKAVITMEGLTGDVSGGDLAILEKTSLEAFNDVFSSYSVALEVFESSLFATESKDTGIAIFIGQTAFIGIHEALEEQWFSNDRAINHLKELHSTFEKELCSKLQDSSSATFSNVYGCSFTMVHDHVM